VPLAARHRLCQSQQRRLRAEEGRTEEQRFRDMLFRRLRGRWHSGDDDARQRSPHRRHVGGVEQLGASIRDRVDELFRAPPSEVERIVPTWAGSVKRIHRRMRGASCAGD